MGPDQKRQIDYVMIGRRHRDKIKDAGVCAKLHLGSDHRGVYMDIELPSHSRAKRWKGDVSKGQSPKGWQPQEPGKHIFELDIRIGDILLDEQLDWVQISLNDKIRILEKTTVETAHHCRRIETNNVSNKDEHDPILTDLMSKRRALAGKHLRAGQENRSSLSKQIQKLMRKCLRRKNSKKIRQILDEFKGLSQIAGIRDHGKKTQCNSIFDMNAVIVEDQQGIVDTSADFHAKFYSAQHGTQLPTDVFSHEPSNIPAFTIDEVKSDLKQMRKCKAADSSGLVVEMFQS